ncbi:MAG TPA: deoxyribonuclease IV [Gemmata sp.]|jgi:deoxyribonuclease-4|nr:deoxyribonuclease IV [Gemmata sp.]
MPLFGAHMSISGGLHNAISAATELGCETLQLFTKNANQWNAKPITDDEVRTFRRALIDSNLKFPTAHDSYLINIASPDDAAYKKSISAFIHELERAEALGLSYLVMHPGAHTGSGEEAGLMRAIAAFDEIHARCPGFQTMVLIETTAGQGTTLGYRFEHVAAIRNGVKQPERLGVCLDTCHVFAAGYALGSEEEYKETFDQFHKAIGLENLKLFHLNDSVKPFNSRVDRHAAIGRGAIGLEPFRRLVNDSRFQNLPMILETPKENDDGEPMDPVNLGILRGLLRTKAVASPG